ncbi:MAG: ATP-binding protein [Streptosporangiaceae bacterium]
MTTGTPDPGTAQVCGAGVTGTRAELIQVQATIGTGPPGLTITGLPDHGIREARDRIRAATLNSGHCWPTGAITVSLSPARACHHGCGTDLPIAVAILAAAGVLPHGASQGHVFAAELGLDGQLRPVRDLVSLLRAAAEADGSVTAVIAPDNWLEACTVPGVRIAPCQSLRQVIAWLRGQQLPWEPYVPVASAPGPHPSPGLAGIGVPPALRQALETSAAGRHHLCLTGRQPIAVTALAAALTAMLPDLDDQQAGEATVAHAAAGLLRSSRAAVTRPPLRVPDHTATVAAMIGGGTPLGPGEAAVAHHGVLCLPDAPDFGRRVLDTLRQPLTSDQIVITRGRVTAQFPARFILIAGLRRCPCGDPGRCTCTPAQIRRYQGRLTATLGAWLPLRVTVDPAAFTGSAAEPPGRDADTVSAERVAAARDRMRHRLAGTPWQLNGDIPRRELALTWPPSADGIAVIDRAVELGGLSDPAAGQVTAVAWTLADLAAKPRPGAAECGQALAYREGTSR